MQLNNVFLMIIARFSLYPCENLNLRGLLLLTFFKGEMHL